MATTQTRGDAIALVVAVMTDRTRSDVYLRRADDGTYFTTPDAAFLGPDGQVVVPPAVMIPLNTEPITEDDADECAAEMLNQLDDALGDFDYVPE